MRLREVENVEIALIKLADSGRLLRFTDRTPGLSIERRIEPVL